MLPTMRVLLPDGNQLEFWAPANMPTRKDVNVAMNGFTPAGSGTQVTGQR